MNLVSILPASHYQLRRKWYNGILLASPRFRTKKTMGDRVFMVAAPVLWNSLPLSVRLTRNVDILKRLLKIYLFSKAFCKDFVVSSILKLIILIEKSAI